MKPGLMKGASQPVRRRGIGIVRIGWGGETVLLRGLTFQ